MAVSAQQANDVLSSILCLLGRLLVFVLLVVVALVADLLIGTETGDAIRTLANEIAAEGC